MAKGQGKGGVTTDGNVFFFEGKVMRIFRNEVVMMVIQLCEFCEYAKTSKLDRIFFFQETLIFIYLFISCLRSGCAWCAASGSLTREGTHAPCIGSGVLITGLPGKFPNWAV